MVARELTYAARGGPLRAARAGPWRAAIRAARGGPAWFQGRYAANELTYHVCRKVHSKINPFRQKSQLLQPGPADARQHDHMIRVIRENPASRGTETSAEVLFLPRKVTTYLLTSRI